MENDEKWCQKGSQKSTKTFKKRGLENSRFLDWFFGRRGSNFPVFLRSHFHPNLPSVRKVTCRKTNKKGKESKKKERLQCRTGQSAWTKPNTPVGAAEQARGGSQLPAAIYPPRACWERLLRKLAFGGAHAAIPDFLQFGCPKISKMAPGDPKSEKIVRQGDKSDPKGTKS